MLIWKTQERKKSMMQNIVNTQLYRIRSICVGFGKVRSAVIKIRGEDSGGGTPLGVSG